MPQHATSSQRQRLLEAAGEIFAEVGFHSATVRQICRRARANVAAIKYHFGGKAGLYREALALAQGCVGDDPPVSASTEPEQRLRELISRRLLQVFDRRRPTWQAHLVSREMVEPTPALDHLVNQHIRPRCERLQAVVRELLGPTATDEHVRHCTLSIIGQCLFYYHARAVLDRLFPEQRFDAKDIDRLANHITEFSLMALDGLKRQLEQTAPQAVVLRFRAGPRGRRVVND